MTLNDSRPALSPEEVDRLRALADDRLGPEERARRARQSARCTAALSNPPHVVNPEWRHALVSDAFDVEPAFGWSEVGRAADEGHRRAIAEIENPTPPTPIRREPATTIARGDRYAAAALTDEADAVASAPPGLRNATLNRAAWSMARLVRDGLIDVGTVEADLIDAGTAVGLPLIEARSTVRGALRRRGAA